MGENNRPTEAQKSWLARAIGPDAWRELCGRRDFLRALETSIANARRMAIRYLAEQERMGRVLTTE